MSNSNQQNNESTAITEATEVYWDWSVCNKIQGKTTAPILPKHLFLLSVHREKILKVRQQLAESTYDIDGRLNVALDRLLEELIG
jgi:hypothetical protein